MLNAWRPRHLSNVSESPVFFFPMSGMNPARYFPAFVVVGNIQTQRRPIMGAQEVQEF